MNGLKANWTKALSILLTRRVPLTDEELLRRLPRIDGTQRKPTTTDFCRIDIRKKSLAHGHFESCNFAYADLRGCNLSDCRFRNCDMRCVRFDRATLSNALISNCNLCGALGFFGSERVLGWPKFDYLLEAPSRFQRWGHDTWYGDFPAWTFLKHFGELPLFTASNVALVALLGYAAIGQWINDGMQRATHRINELALDASSPTISEILSTIPKTPTPPQFGYLLLAIVGLIVASIMYKSRCPEVISTFRRIQREEKSAQVLEYNSANYAFPLWRHICGMLYLVAGSYSVLYLLVRVYSAVSFYFRINE